MSCDGAKREQRRAEMRAYAEAMVGTPADLDPDLEGAGLEAITRTSCDDARCMDERKRRTARAAASGAVDDEARALVERVRAARTRG